MKKSHKRLLVGSSIAAGVVGLGTASYAVGKFLMKVALDRTPPSVVNDKSKDMLRGSGELSALEERLQDAAHKLETCETETVRITASDGTELAGHWRKAPEAKRTIIAMHGGALPGPEILALLLTFGTGMAAMSSMQSSAARAAAEAIIWASDFWNVLIVWIGLIGSMNNLSMKSLST